MRNISYFCIVKRFRHIFMCVVTTIFLLLTNGAMAQNSEATQPEDLDSLDISLLTCGPRQTVYALYGHTAMRLHNRATGTDVVVNYGMFSFEKPFFVLRFVFGLTDYAMGLEDFQRFFNHYQSYGATVIEQKLNLTKAEKVAIMKALEENYLPENRVYRYNYFYDNCTTRARDIILGSINGTIRYANRIDESQTFRSMIHSYNEDSRWARFGNDLLLGVASDFRTNRQQQQFLPDNTRKDFDNAVVVGKNGEKRKLVAETTRLLDDGEKEDMGSFPLSPTATALLFAFIVMAVSVYERVKNKMYWGIDAVLMTITGACGIILFAMIFSQHPTVKVNFQILLLNPLTLVFLYPSIKKMCRRKVHFWLPTYALCIVIFFFCGFFQSYAEGIGIVALSLLVRYVLKIDQLVRTK